MAILFLDLTCNYQHKHKHTMSLFGFGFGAAAPAAPTATASASAAAPFVFPGTASFSASSTSTSTPIVISADARGMARRHGLDFVTIAWEDCARTKNSSWGPCISDMTLRANGHLMPMLRQPNFADKTWDAPMSSIRLNVSNGNGGGSGYFPSSPPASVTLDTYLASVGKRSAFNFRGKPINLYAPERDSHVIVSTQACFLETQGAGSDHQDVPFNVALRVYQADAPILVIIATSKGTTAQVVNSASRVHDLFVCTPSGQRARIVAQRLSKNRAERGVTYTGAMTAEEQQDNFIMIIQVPLKSMRPRPQLETTLCTFGGPVYRGGGRGADTERIQRTADACDVEDAILKVGEAEGAFESNFGVFDQDCVRDARYPVRVTLQFYKMTSNGVMSEAAIDGIAAQFTAARADARVFSSLVTDYTDRPTEVVPAPAALPAPAAATTADVHPGVTCDWCSQPIRGGGGVRYKCMECPNVDACEACERTRAQSPPTVAPRHTPQHLFIKIRDTRQHPHNMHVQNRSEMTHKRACAGGCGSLSIVGICYFCSACNLGYCEACDATVGHQTTTGHNMLRVSHSA